MRQAVVRAVGESIRLPIRAQLAKIIVERAILLRHKDNVIQHVHGLAYVECRGDRLGGVHHDLASGGVASARPGPRCKIGSPRRSCGEGDDGSRGERRAAGGRATDSGGAAGDGAAGSAG